MAGFANAEVDSVAKRASAIVVAALRPLAVQVILFGSRARGDAGVRSDVDLAVVSDAPLPPEALARAREALEESTIAQHVDLIDLATADPALRAHVLEEGRQCAG